MKYVFRGWDIVINSGQQLRVIIDKDEKNLIIFDEDKDLFGWIYPSDFGNGFGMEKMSWSCSFHVLPDEKKIIVMSSNTVRE